MNNKTESIIKILNNEIITITNGITENILLYAEVEDRVCSADLFYKDNISKNIIGIIGNDKLCNIVYGLWEEMKSIKREGWRILIYSAANNKYSIDFRYNDQIDINEDVSDRRPKYIKDYFGDTKIEYK